MIDPAKPNEQLYRWFWKAKFRSGAARPFACWPEAA